MSLASTRSNGAGTFFSAVDRSHRSALETFAADYYDETFERFPEQASRLGKETFRDRLGGNSPADHRAQIRLARRTLAAVERLPEAAFSGDAWLDLKTFTAQLRTHLLTHDTLARWRTNPQLHCDAAIDAVFDLVIHASGGLARALPAIESRLRAIGDFLAAGLSCVRRPDPLWCELTARSCHGGAEFFDQLAPELAAVSPHPKRTRNLLRAASKALLAYAEGVRRKRKAPAGSFAAGAAVFNRLIAERLGFDLTARQIEANGRRQIARLEFLLQQEARKLGTKNAAERLAEAAEAWTPGRPLLALYRSTTAALKRRLREAGIVALPGRESLEVRPVPPFMRHQFPTAAYSAPGPFARKQQGIFWVNDLSLNTADPERARAEIRQHFGLELTCVHEAYPGHHLQFVVQNRQPGIIRKLADHAVFYEGWTMWCELMAVRHGLVEDPHARLLQLNDALWRAHRIVIDCGLQTGHLSFDRACRTLMHGVGFTRARAEADVNWYTSAPTVPMSYLLGRLEVEKLHDHFVIGERWPLCDFNDWIVSHGAIPWSWIWQARLRGGERVDR